MMVVLINSYSIIMYFPFVERPYILTKFCRTVRQPFVSHRFTVVKGNIFLDMKFVKTSNEQIVDNEEPCQVLFPRGHWCNPVAVNFSHRVLHQFFLVQ